MIEEAAVPACSCGECRRPTPDNEAVRTFHAERHAGFMDWLAERGVKPHELSPRRKWTAWAEEFSDPDVGRMPRRRLQ